MKFVLLGNGVVRKECGGVKKRKKRKKDEKEKREEKKKKPVQPTSYAVAIGEIKFGEKGACFQFLLSNGSSLLSSSLLHLLFLLTWH